MAKSKFTRENVKSPILKKVLIRIDYDGASSIDSLIIKLKNTWNHYFQNYQKVTKNNFNINVTDNALQSKTISIPDPELKIIHRFTSCKIGESSTYMDISDNFAYIDIVVGENYVGTEKYINIMSEFIKSLLASDSFIVLSRVAIRKLDVIKKTANEDPDTILEVPISSTYNDNNRIQLKKQYKDTILLKDVDSVVNIVRDLTYEKDKNDKIMRRIILDMDIYKQAPQKIAIDQQTPITRIKDILNKQLNEPLFGLFVETFKETYINDFMI